MNSGRGLSGSVSLLFAGVGFELTSTTHWGSFVFANVLAWVIWSNSPSGKQLISA